MRGRGGFMAAEAVVAASLLLLVIQAAWSVLAVQGAAAVRVVDGARILDETRLIGHVLGLEVRPGLAGRDWSAIGDELRLRAFRGLGFACPNQPASGWGVNVSGHRGTDSDKDSVLVLGPDGTWSTAALARRIRGRNLNCPTAVGFTPQVWRLDPPVPDGVAGLYFERGSYRLSDGAFRYRRGARWQPLTGAGLATDSTGLSAAGAGVGLGVRLDWKSKGASAHRRAFVPSSRRWTVWGRR